jgi:hypothetical protein
MIQNLSLSSESVVLTPACINHLCLSEIIKETTGWLDGNKMGGSIFLSLSARETRPLILISLLAQDSLRTTGLLLLSSL